MQHQTILLETPQNAAHDGSISPVGELVRVQRAKLMFDRILILLFSPILLPVLALVALAVRIESPGPVFFRQTRYGLNGEIFRVTKFRTMYHGGDTSGAQQTQVGDARVTGMGRILRRTCLDELPQIWDVFRGKMSLVGPRPHPVAMRIDGALMEAIYPDYAARLALRPGMTGLAQVNGNRGPVHDVATGQERLDYDRTYIAGWSLWGDVKLLMKTVVLPFKRGCY